MTIRMIRGLIRIRSGSDPILIRIVFFDPFGSADYEFTIRSVSDPRIRIGSDILRNPTTRNMTLEYTMIEPLSYTFEIF